MTDSPVATSPELRRLSLLREFKIRRLKIGADNSSPFIDRVVTAYGDQHRIDLTGLHSEVRDNIVQQIIAVRDQQRSQVVLLSGDAGTGKSHILRHFAQPAIAEEHGYVFVGGSNDWKVDEFQHCLLDWMITALTAPTPSKDHLLLERVRAIGFRAVGQLLENRTVLRRCTVQRRRGWLGRVIGRRRASYETIEKLVKARDPEVFKFLDFSRFTDEVCTRFLAEPSNPVHRYALRVLLTYLFPDEYDDGVGTRERVLNWFRRKPDDGYWVRRLGVGDDLDRRYAVADAIKLLIHLFSPDLTRRLSVDGDVGRPLVFMFVFDQAEGRDELFDTTEDWNLFFAHLSELYNTLPNVLVLFTMTLHKRNELHPKMEAQFRDRIRKDERFVLRQPSPEELWALYRARLSDWLSDDPIQQSYYNALPEDEQYLPFGPDRVLELGSKRSVREALEAFDPPFKKALEDVVIDPSIDFETVLNAQQGEIKNQNEYEYTAPHLDTVRSVLEPLTDDLAFVYSGVKLTGVAEETLNGLRFLRFELADPAVTTSWVVVYLTRFGKNVNPHIPTCEGQLYHKKTARYSVWMVRANTFDPKLGRPNQMFFRHAPVDIEARLRAAVHLVSKRAEYEKKATWPDAWKLILEVIRESYLGDLLSHTRDRVNAIKAGAVPDEPALT